MSAYYNESDRHAADWLRNLVSAGLICPGDVDDRDIRDVCAADLRPYTQHHFFAGVGTWSLALRMAGWPDDRAVTTGSCPCQPFSIAGKGDGFADQRHLWPAWHWLLGQYRPDVIFGEQVASKAAGPWLDLVSVDLENLGYAVAPVVLPAACVGAPHGRHRLFWVGDATNVRLDRSQPIGTEPGCRIGPADASQLGDASSARLPDAEPQDTEGAWRWREGRAVEQSGGPSDPWRELEWIDCLDGKSRPTQPAYVRMVARHSRHVGRLRSATDSHEEVGDSPTSAADRPEALPSLREGIDADAPISMRRPGNQTDLCQAGLLRQDVYERSDDRENKGSQHQSQSPPVSESGIGAMRIVRPHTAIRQAPRSPRRSEPDEQRSAQFEDVVRLLSPSLSLAEFYRDWRTARELSALRAAIVKAGIVRDPSHSVSEIWGRLDDEDKNIIRLQFGSPDWIMVNPFPLAHRHPGDVAKLRAYGNAISPQVAAEVIAAYMDCRH